MTRLIQEFGTTEEWKKSSGRMKDLEESCEALRKLADAQRVLIVTQGCEIADLKDERLNLQTTILGLKAEVKKLEKHVHILKL